MCWRFLITEIVHMSGEYSEIVQTLLWQSAVPIRGCRTVALAAHAEILACAEQSDVRLSCGWYWMSELKLHLLGRKTLISFLFLLFNQETLLRNQTLRLWSYNKFNASETERWVLQIQIWNVVLTIILNVLKKMQEELVWTGQFNSILVLYSTKKSLWQPVE